MRSRKALWLLVIALLATALVAAGCGSSNDKSSNDTTAAQTTAATPPPATTDATTPPATTDTGGGTDTSGGGGASDPAIQAAVDACKQQIAAAPTLNDKTKADLNKICEEITSSDPAQIKKVAQDVCTKIVDDSNLPDGPAKDQAKQACASVGG